MSGISVAAIAFFQEAELTKHDVHLSMWFLGTIAFALVVAALGIVVAGVFAAKLVARLDGIIKTVEQHTGPILEKTNALIADLSPKVQSVSTNVEQMSYTVRAKMEEIGETVSQLNQTVQQINGKTRTQVTRVDGIVSNALAATEEISANVQNSIRIPVRQVAGVVAGLKKGLDTFIARSPFGRG